MDVSSILSPMPCKTAYFDFNSSLSCCILILHPSTKAPDPNLNARGIDERMTSPNLPSFSSSDHNNDDSR